MSKLFLPKHARTHLPGGSDPLPISTTDAGNSPYIRRSTGGTIITVASGSSNEEPITFAGTSGSVDPDYTTYFGTPNAVNISLFGAGIYSVFGEILWLATFTAPTWVNLADGINFSTGLPGTSVSRSGPNTSGFFFQGRWAAGTQLSFDVGQASGSDQDLDAWYVEVHYVRSYDGQERVDDPEFPQ